MSALTISRLAEQAGVHIETIRYYERRGLLAPPPRTEAGYRQYSAGDVWRLEFIQRAKQLGFTLNEIIELFGPDGARSADENSRRSLLRFSKTTLAFHLSSQLARTLALLRRVVGPKIA